MSHDPTSPRYNPWSPSEGAYPSQGAPPVAGHPGVQSAPPTVPNPAVWSTAPEPSAPNQRAARRRSDERPPSQKRGLVAVALVSALIAGTAGGVVGAVVTADDGVTAGNASAVSTRSVSTEVPPVSGDALEPAAAVAQALAPAVVQIETGSGLGSGFIYDESGLIMTAAHVVDGATAVTIRMADGTRAEGQVVGGDPSTDVAVISIDPIEGMPVATLATGVTTQVGQTAIAIGSPFGLDQTVTAGIVSAVGRSSETPGGVVPAIQTDAPINSGNSGGALADRQGRVIGVNSSIVTGGGESTGNLGVGFAIPIDIAKSVADRLVAGESTEAGFLGVEGADATGDRAGATITSVSAGSPADEAGVGESDVVVAVDGKQVASMIDLAAKVRTHEPGEEVTLTVERNGTSLDITVTLGASTPN